MNNQSRYDILKDSWKFYLITSIVAVTVIGYAYFKKHNITSTTDNTNQSKLEEIASNNKNFPKEKL